MKRNTIVSILVKPQICPNALVAIMTSLMITLVVSNVSAFEAYRGKDTKVRFDTSVKYSTSYRLLDQDSDLVDAAHINNDDGDRNFDKGFTSNRLDVSSELDVTYHNYGVRVSGAGWVDSVYLSDNDNDSPSTYNGIDDNDEFDDDTKRLHGDNIELLDAFVFGREKVGGMPASFRLGRHTSLWGETLFFASNGIAHSQAPIDIAKAVSVPNTQAKELFMPVNQISAQLQITNKLSIASYWQFEWRRSRMFGAGSYFSDVDLIDAGGRNILLPTPIGLMKISRGDDLGAGDSTSEFGESNYDNFGLSMHYRSEQLDTDFGFFYTHYNENMPYWTYIEPMAGEYYMVFPEDIHMIGASFGTQIGEANVSGEVSARFGTPLVSNADTQIVLPGMSADNDNNPLYAVGDTLHANISAIYLLGPASLWDGGSLLGEIGFNYLMDKTDNAQNFDENRDDYALGIRLLFEPTYFQVLSGIDMRVPIGFGYNPMGKSPMDLKFNGGGADEGGDFSIGLGIDYHTVWKLDVKYTNYYGDSDYQTLADRDFLSLSLQRTF